MNWDSFSWVDCIWGSLAIEFSICAKKKRKKENELGNNLTFGTLP